MSDHGSRGGYYYYFKTFKVYRAYRWLVCKEMDERGSLSPTDKTCTIRIKTNYADKY